MKCERWIDQRDTNVGQKKLWVARIETMTSWTPGGWGGGWGRYYIPKALSIHLSIHLAILHPSLHLSGRQSDSETVSQPVSQLVHLSFCQSVSAVYNVPSPFSISTAECDLPQEICWILDDRLAFTLRSTKNGPYSKGKTNQLVCSFKVTPCTLNITFILLSL